MPPIINLIHPKRDVGVVVSVRHVEGFFELVEAELVRVLPIKVDYDQVAESVSKVDTCNWDLSIEHAG